MSIETTNISECLTKMERGELSSEALVQDLLQSIKKNDPDICAYLHIDGEDAVRQAREADRRRKAGDKAPLLGIPIAVKDNLNVTGQSCTCASKILAGYKSPYDATAIARLRDAGAVFVGRTNMDEFAMGSTTENSAFQVTKNPRAKDHVAGGSSGGSAAAVAAGHALAALGSDTGGSIRLPASFCGCVGLKPTYGRVSRYGLVAFASSLDQIGPLTRTVRDSALMLSVMAGRDPMDSTTLDVPVPDYASGLDRGVKGMRLGLPREYFVAGIDPEVRRCVDDAVRKVKLLGADIVEVSLPHTEYAVAAYYVIATAEASANLARFDGVRYGARFPDASEPLEMYRKTRALGFGAEVKRRIILGTYVLSSGYYDAYYLTAQKVRTLLAADFLKAFSQCDAMLTPVSPVAGYKIGQNVADPLHMYLGDIYTVTANLGGICGMSVPAGRTAEGLPVGVQVLGPALGEEAILRVGAALEQS